VTDLNLLVGTDSYDAALQTGDPACAWVNPTYANDGNDSTQATITNSLSAYDSWLVADLGALYLCTAFNILSGSFDLNITTFWYWDGAAWQPITYTTAGSLTPNPGETFTFTAPITAQKFAIRSHNLGGYNSGDHVARWAIIGTPVPSGMMPGEPGGSMW
jgi:hypothetical protein